MVMKEVVALFRSSVSHESTKFALNTIYNHANTDGITLSGKMSHHKHSCGAANIASSVLEKGNSEEKPVIVGNQDTDNSFGFTYVPQTRLHGAGWYVS